MNKKKQMSHRNSVYDLIIVTYYTYPCYHPVLENIFAKHIGKKKKILWLMKGDKKLKNRQDWYNSNVQLVGINQNGHDNSITKIKNKLKDIALFLTLIKLIKTNCPKTILIRDMPAFVFLVFILKPFCNINIYYQYSAPQGDISINSFKNDKKFWKLNYLIKGFFFNIMNKLALTTADLIISISSYHKNEIKKKYPNKYVVPLTMGVDEDWILKKDCSNNTLEKLKRNDFWITYFGALNSVRNPMFILQLYKLIYKKIPNSRLVLIGKYSISEWQHYLDNTTISSIKDRLLLVGHVNKDKLRQYLWYTDITLSPIPPTKYYIISSPTKIYESLGMKVPVIANLEILEQKDVILNSSGGILVPYNIKDFANAAIKILQNEEHRTKCGMLGKKYILKNYTYKSLADRIVNLF